MSAVSRQGFVQNGNESADIVSMGSFVVSSWKQSLLLHLGVTITLSISIIEAAVYLTSYESQKAQLVELRDALKREFQQWPGQELQVEVLSQSDIQRRLKKYKSDYFILLLPTILFVTIINVVAYQRFVGRHISTLRDLIRQTDEHKIAYFPEEEIPPNDLGEVIRDRNRQMKKLENYQHRLEDKLKESEENLVHAAKLSALGELTSTLAHDLSNPLAVILGNVEFLKEPVRSLNDEKAFRRLKKIYMASERIGKLVKRMGSQSRSEFSINDKLDLSQVLGNALVMLESKIKGSMVEVVNVLSSDARLVKADEGALEQVFMNLISNASDALVDTENARVVISSQKQDDFVEVRIRDNGPGIPEEIKDTLFGSFVTTKPAGKGTGLGLSICQQIVEIHGGSIEVGPSEEGAEFIIRLPSS